MNVTPEMRNSYTSNFSHPASAQNSNSSGQRRQPHKKNSLRELEEESLPLMDPTNAFNSSTLEINAESSSGSSVTSSSGSYPKSKTDLIQV